MAKPFFVDGFVKALIGFYAVYLLILIARAGFETGQLLAGRTTLAEAAARFDMPAALLVASGLVLLVSLRKVPPR